jgi:hypothetical protein
MQNQEVETLKNNTPEYIKLSHLWRQSHSGVAGLIISNAQSIVKRIYKVSRLSQRLASDDSGSNCQPEVTGGHAVRESCNISG